MDLFLASGRGSEVEGIPLEGDGGRGELRSLFPFSNRSGDRGEYVLGHAVDHSPLSPRSSEVISPSGDTVDGRESLSSE